MYKHLNPALLAASAAIICLSFCLKVDEIGLDTGDIYQSISFSASVSDWETHIYEDNNVF